MVFNCESACKLHTANFITTSSDFVLRSTSAYMLVNMAVNDTDITLTLVLGQVILSLNHGEQFVAMQVLMKVVALLWTFVIIIIN